MYNIQYNFECDHKKASQTFSKHSVTFEEAATVFKETDERNSTIRIFSARKATQIESKQYKG